MIDNECAAVGGMRAFSGENEILRENVAQCHFIHHKSHII
jgi:hypothetical protein